MAGVPLLPHISVGLFIGRGAFRRQKEALNSIPEGNKIAWWVALETEPLRSLIALEPGDPTHSDKTGGVIWDKILPKSQSPKR